MKHLNIRRIGSSAALMVVLSQSSAAFPQIPIPDTLPECQQALKACNAGSGKLQGELKRCEQFVEDNCDVGKYEQYKKEHPLPTTSKLAAKKPLVVPTCPDEKIVQDGDGQKSVVGHVRPVCTFPAKDLLIFAREVRERIDAMCHADKIKLSEEERALLEESDPNLLHRVEGYNDPPQCETADAHLVALIAFMEKQERMNAEQIVFNTKIESAITGLAMDVSSLEATLTNMCQPEEGQSLAEACQALGDMVRNHEKRITTLEEDNEKQWDAIRSFRLDGVRLQAGVMAEGLVRPGGGLSTGILGLRFNVLSGLSDDVGILAGGYIGGATWSGDVPSWANKGQLHMGASLNLFFPLNGHDDSSASDDADGEADDHDSGSSVPVALHVGPKFSAGFPIRDHADEVNVLLVLGAMVLPSRKLAVDFGVEAGGGRNSLYAERDGVRYHGVSDVGFVAGAQVTLLYSPPQF